MVEAVTLNERLKQIGYVNTKLATTIPWICDGLDGTVEKALGGAPNSEFVVDKKGIVIRKRFWHDPEDLRGFLAERFGEVEQPTTVAALDLKPAVPQKQLRRGLKVPLGMKLCDATPHRKTSPANPLYVKLMVEAEPKLLKSGSGKLWLGLFPDPIYEAAWNPKSAPIRYELSSNDPKFKTIKGEIAHDEDAETSRELLLNLAGIKKDADYMLKADFSLEVGGQSQSFSEQYQFQIKASQRKARRSGEWMLRLIGDPMALDSNQDRKVEKHELPKERAQIYLLHYDLNHDSEISAEEATIFEETIRHPVKKGP